MNGKTNGSEYRHLSTNDGQDWVVNSDCCKIPEEIEDVKSGFGFTIRLSECMKAGATSFKDFDDSKQAKLWERIFQSFLLLGETMIARLTTVVQNSGGDIGHKELVMLYLEPVLDREKFVEDLTTPYCKTSATAYTIWILLRDAQGTERLFDVPHMYNEIKKIAADYCQKVSGENASAVKKVENIMRNPGYTEDEDDGGKGKGKKGGIKKQPQLSELPKHERWKLIENDEVFASLHDLMMHSEEWQTDRLNEMTQMPAHVKNNASDAAVIFSPVTAFYARPKNCLRNQQPFNWSNVFIYNPEKRNFTVKFPMAKWVLKIPPNQFTVESFLNRKLPLYQLNSTYSVTKMLPIIVDSIETTIEDELAEQEIKNKKLLSKNKSIWESEYSGYQEVVSYIMGKSSSGDEEPFGSASDSDPDQEELIQFSTQAKKLALSTKFSEQGGMKSKSPADVVKLIFDEGKKIQNESDRLLKSNQAISKLKSMFERFGMKPLFQKTVMKNNGKINRLIPSQLTNCTTMWPEGTDTRDNNQDDHYEFISIYAMLEAQASYGMQALKNIIKRIENNELGVERIENPKVIIRKLLILLKRHMLKEYVTKCMTEDSYGLSPYEKAILKYGNQEGLFNLKLTHTKFDKSLGLFSNMECANYIKISSFLHMSQHILRPMSLALKYSMDSLRLEYDLHLNMLMFDKDGASGKSEVTNQLIECSIKDSVRTEAYKSAKSDLCAEGNMNSGTKVLPELQQSLVRDGDPNNDQGRMFKDVLTSGVSTGTRLVRKDDGSYTQQFIRSENIASYVGSSNANLYNLPRPVQSRFHLVLVEKNQVPWRDVLHVKSEEKTSGERLDNSQNHFKQETRFFQYMIYHMERLTKIRYFHKPTMDIAWIFMLVLQRTLNGRGILMSNVRVPSSLVNLSRQNMFRESIERNWLHRGAKYNGKNIMMDHFFDLDVMLFVTPEHIVAAIGEAADRIIKTSTDTVRKAIRSYFYEIEGQQRFKGRKRRNQLPPLAKPDHITNNARKYTLDFNWMRFGIGNGPEEFYRKISNQSFKFADGDTVTPESVEEVIRGWLDCRTDVPTYGYLGDVNNENSMDEDGKPVEPALNEIRVDNSVPLRKQPLVDMCGDSIFFLWHYFSEENPKSGMTELKESIISILSCSHQLNDKFIFSCNTEFPFIRELISITEETKRLNGDNLISFPSLNLVKSEMKKVLAATSYSKLMEDTDTTECDVTAIGVDLATYSMRKRLEQLYITKDSINGDYANFNIFSGMIKRAADLTKMTQIQKEALSFLDNNDYNRKGNGYFMGEELDHITKAENIFDPNEMARNLKKFYTILDKVDQTPKRNRDGLLLPRDDDFDPECYVVEQCVNMHNEIVKKYHWDCYPSESYLSKPEYYKLMRHHPKVANDFFNRKNADLTIGSGCYPSMIIQEYKNAKEIQPNILKNSNLSNPNLAKLVANKQIKLDDYDLIKDSDGNVTGLMAAKENPFADIELVYGAKPTPNKTQRKAFSKVIKRQLHDELCESSDFEFQLKKRKVIKPRQRNF
jgi:hypothetical protein